MNFVSDFPDALEQPAHEAPLAAYAASVQPLSLLPGVYAFSIPGPRAGRDQLQSETVPQPKLQLPALSIGPAPVEQVTKIQQFNSPGTLERWLTQAGDRITVRVMEAPATMMIHSVRPPDAPALALEVKRLDIPQSRSDTSAMEVMLHVQRLGDLYFDEGAIHPIGSGLAVEAFVIDSTDANGACIIEYRGRTADQFETPWLTDRMLCGSRGRGVPLMGFAVRTRYTAAERFEFKYRGYFRRAGWVEPTTPGDWCQSPEPNDPLEGLEIHRTQRT